MTAAMAFIRLETGVSYELISCVALVKPAAPLLPAITSDTANVNVQKAIVAFRPNARHDSLMRCTAPLIIDLILLFDEMFLFVYLILSLKEQVSLKEREGFLALYI